VRVRLKTRLLTEKRLLWEKRGLAIGKGIDWDQRKINKGNRGRGKGEKRAPGMVFLGFMVEQGAERAKQRKRGACAQEPWREKETKIPRHQISKREKRRRGDNRKVTGEEKDSTL